MSTMRQHGTTDGFQVRSLAVTYRDGHRIERHSHAWAQLIYAATGTMRVSTDAATWLVPPTRAIWAPAGIVHEIQMRGRTAIRTLYVAPGSAGLSAECRAFEVSPLLREIILHIVECGMLRVERDDHARLFGVLLDLLASAETTPLGLPLPHDRRARQVAERLLAHPADRIPLTRIARDASASLRTLQRRFVRETGLSLEAWRMRARLQHGVVCLAAGQSVTAAAIDAGYASPSAFIAAFKQAFGTTPARYRRRR
jgi:AraC-like DNA-binding protein